MPERNPRPAASGEEASAGDADRGDAVIVLIHGLWMNGMDMSLLRRRLRQYGHPVRQFRYRSRRETPAANARELARFVAELPHSVAHFVCHSLGGLVIRHYFADPANRPGFKPGRIVTLGTPHQGSAAAGQLRRCAPGRMMLGKSVERGLLGDSPPWSGGRELGCIAGTLRLGLGLLVPGIPAPSDSVVAVAETKLENIADYIQIHTSHIGLLFSNTVARQCDHFIRHGRFQR